MSPHLRSGSHSQASKEQGKKGISWTTLALPLSRRPRFLILGDPEKPDSRKLAKQLVQQIGARAKVVDSEFRRSKRPIESRPDVVFVLGGDGSMLAAFHRMGSRQVPVVGINVGRIGFLSPYAPEEAASILDQVLEGKARFEEHTAMRVTVKRGKKEILDTRILNEVVVNRSGPGMVEVDLFVDRRPVCSYRGDGLIVSTATGSTAYSLSAGGPVLSPRLEAWVVTPLAPHSLNQRPLVLPSSRTARLQVDQPCLMTADGLSETKLRAGDTVKVAPSGLRFKLVCGPSVNFFARLRSKLHWGAAPGPG